MKTFFSAARNFARDDNGITAIEYGLIAALMAAVIGTAVKAVVGNDNTAGLKHVFNSIGLALTSSIP